MNSYLQQARELIEIATKGMSHDELAWHPAEGKWSTANILEHLMLAFSGTAKGLSRVLQAGAPQVRQQTWKDRGRVAVVVNAGYFPPGRPAPKGVVPQGIGPDEAMRGIRSQLEAMEKVMQECERRLGSSGKVLDHPVLGPLNLRQWAKFHFVHTRHHMRQVQTLREKMKSVTSG